MKLPFANKDLGQHFLKDKNIINAICQNFAHKADAIIEIGPGPGILTEELARHALPFHVVEIDSKFVPYLTKWLAPESITITDALSMDLTEFIEKRELKNVWLVSNLPYQISAPLFIKFAKESQIKYMTLMFQKEVAAKIIPIAGKKTDKHLKKNMGSLMVLAYNYFECSLLKKVAPGAFLPPPKVDSSVISFIRRESPQISVEEFNQFEEFLRKLFSFRRKQIFKVLKSHFDSDRLAQVLKNNLIDKNSRAEALNMMQIRILYDALRS